MWSETNIYHTLWSQITLSCRPPDEKANNTIVAYKKKKKKTGFHGEKRQCGRRRADESYFRCQAAMAPDNTNHVTSDTLGEKY